MTGTRQLIEQSITIDRTVQSEVVSLLHVSAVFGHFRVDNRQRKTQRWLIMS